MKHKPKVIVVMPAHNAAKTLTNSYKRLPKQYVDEIILVDDASTDNTYQIAKKFPITVFRNDLNLGYGGNLKVCLVKALAHGADIIIEFHPDNQYDPETLPQFLKKVRDGYDFALGSRFIHPREALEHHMPWVKFIANRGLTFIDQFALGIELSEFHSGFRAYTKKLLNTVPFLQNSDDYLFSFEIIVQAVYYNFKVAEVQIACDYHPDMHTANLKKSTIYALGTFKTLAQYTKAKFLHQPQGPFKSIPQRSCPWCKQSITRRLYEVTDAVSQKVFSIYFCTPCQIGFTYPRPSDLSPFYTKTYYSKIKTQIYSWLQYRRPRLIKQTISAGKILDIGCGEGTIGNQLDQITYDYTGIETPFAAVKNPRVKRVGTEGMKEKANTYELVTFWESFEHLKDPGNVLNKSLKTLKKGGFLMIECPNFSSWERLPFTNCWFHLDPPRHFFHYTPQGLSQKLERLGLRIITKKTIYAPEYIPVGLAQSLLYRISPRLNVFAQTYSKKRSIFLPLLLFTVAIIMLPISYVFFLFNGSPIQLIIAQKYKTI